LPLPLPLRTSGYRTSRYCVPASSPLDTEGRRVINHATFFNYTFDKGRLKNLVYWTLENYGQYKTVELLEQLKKTGFEYATIAGISLGIDDLKIPPKKNTLLLEAEQLTKLTVHQYERADITAVERFQRLIDTWHRTSEQLKQEVIQFFEETDILNPVYMMAFSGARGNISQVRQLVGMRGLMSDPQGKIIDFPIISNFREGLTLTEYIISSYGARKGIVDTALRTANAGYLTRRLVDVAQHVIISHYDCGTYRGIFLTEMKEGSKTIVSLQNRVIGRVLAMDVYKNIKKEKQSIFNPFVLRGRSSQGKNQGNKNSIGTNTKELNYFSSNSNTLVFKRNTEISPDISFELSKFTNKIFVRSSLTCNTKNQICQLCYGWSLAQGNIISVGEAVGVIAAQSIGEPGTQLTMRTFHTGGVFSGDVSDEIRAPQNGFVTYENTIPGILIRALDGKILFLTKADGVLLYHKYNTDLYPAERKGSDSFNKTEEKNLNIRKTESFFSINKGHNSLPKNTILAKKYKIPSYTLLFVRNGESVIEKQVICQITSIKNKYTMRDTAELTIKSELEGLFYAKNLKVEKKLQGPKPKYMGSSKQTPFYDEKTMDVILKAQGWNFAMVLSGKHYYSNTLLKNIPLIGDYINSKTIINKYFIFKSELYKTTNNSIITENKKQASTQRPENKYKTIPETLQPATLESKLEKLRFLSTLKYCNTGNEAAPSYFGLKKKVPNTKLMPNNRFNINFFKIGYFIFSKKVFLDFFNPGLNYPINSHFYTNIGKPLPLRTSGYSTSRYRTLSPFLSPLYHQPLVPCNSRDEGPFVPQGINQGINQVKQNPSLFGVKKNGEKQRNILQRKNKHQNIKKSIFLLPTMFKQLNFGRNKFLFKKVKKDFFYNFYDSAQIHNPFMLQGRDKQRYFFLDKHSNKTNYSKSSFVKNLHFSDKVLTESLYRNNYPEVIAGVRKVNNQNLKGNNTSKNNLLNQFENNIFFGNQVLFRKINNRLYKNYPEKLPYWQQKEILFYIKLKSHLYNSNFFYLQNLTLIIIQKLFEFLFYSKEHKPALCLKNNLLTIYYNNTIVHKYFYKKYTLQTKKNEKYSLFFPPFVPQRKTQDKNTLNNLFNRFESLSISEKNEKHCTKFTNIYQNIFKNYLKTLGPSSPPSSLAVKIGLQKTAKMENKILGALNKHKKNFENNPGQFELFNLLNADNTKSFEGKKFFKKKSSKTIQYFEKNFRKHNPPPSSSLNNSTRFNTKYSLNILFSSYFKKSRLQFKIPAFSSLVPPFPVVPIGRSFQGKNQDNKINYYFKILQRPPQSLPSSFSSLKTSGPSFLGLGYELFKQQDGYTFFLEKSELPAFFCPVFIYTFFSVNTFKKLETYRKNFHGNKKNQSKKYKNISGHFQTLEKNNWPIIKNFKNSWPTTYKLKTFLLKKLVGNFRYSIKSPLSNKENTKKIYLKKNIFIYLYNFYNNKNFYYPFTNKKKDWYKSPYYKIWNPLVSLFVPPFPFVPMRRSSQGKNNYIFFIPFFYMEIIFSKKTNLDSGIILAPAYSGLEKVQSFFPAFINFPFLMFTKGFFQQSLHQNKDLYSPLHPFPFVPRVTVPQGNNQGNNTSPFDSSYPSSLWLQSKQPEHLEKNLIRPLPAYFTVTLANLDYEFRNPKKNKNKPAKFFKKTPEYILQPFPFVPIGRSSQGKNQDTYQGRVSNNDNNQSKYKYQKPEPDISTILLFRNIKKNLNMVCNKKIRFLPNDSKKQKYPAQFLEKSNIFYIFESITYEIFKKPFFILQFLNTDLNSSLFRFVPPLVSPFPFVPMGRFSQGANQGNIMVTAPISRPSYLGLQVTPLLSQNINQGLEQNQLFFGKYFNVYSKKHTDRLLLKKDLFLVQNPEKKDRIFFSPFEGELVYTKTNKRLDLKYLWLFKNNNRKTDIFNNYSQSFIPVSKNRPSSLPSFIAPRFLAVKRVKTGLHSNSSSIFTNRFQDRVNLGQTLVWYKNLLKIIKQSKNQFTKKFVHNNWSIFSLFLTKKDLISLQLDPGLKNNKKYLPFPLPFRLVPPFVPQGKNQVTIPMVFSSQEVNQGKNKSQSFYQKQIPLVFNKLDRTAGLKPETKKFKYKFSNQLDKNEKINYLVCTNLIKNQKNILGFSLNLQAGNKENIFNKNFKNNSFKFISDRNYSHIRTSIFYNLKLQFYKNLSAFSKNKIGLVFLKGTEFLNNLGPDIYHIQNNPDLSLRSRALVPGIPGPVILKKYILENQFLDYAGLEQNNSLEFQKIHLTNSFLTFKKFLNGQNLFYTTLTLEKSPSNPASSPSSRYQGRVSKKGNNQGQESKVFSKKQRLVFYKSFGNKKLQKTKINFFINSKMDYYPETNNSKVLFKKRTLMLKNFSPLVPPFPIVPRMTEPGKNQEPENLFPETSFFSDYCTILKISLFKKLKIYKLTNTRIKNIFYFLDKLGLAGFYTKKNLEPAKYFPLIFPPSAFYTARDEGAFLGLQSLGVKIGLQATLKNILLPEYLFLVLANYFSKKQYIFILVQKNNFNPEDFLNFNNQPENKFFQPFEILKYIKKSGILIQQSKKTCTLRLGQPLVISPQSIIHYYHEDFISLQTNVITLTYQQLKTGDIVQGIPKIEQLFEARTTKRGRLFKDNVQNLLNGLFLKYFTKYTLILRKIQTPYSPGIKPADFLEEFVPPLVPQGKNKKKYKEHFRTSTRFWTILLTLALQWSVKQSFYKIQTVIISGILLVYMSQGVTIADKHVEIIVKQMTSKVRIINYNKKKLDQYHFNLSLVQKICNIQKKNQTKKLFINKLLESLFLNNLDSPTGLFPGEIIDLYFVEIINNYLLKNNMQNRLFQLSKNSDISSILSGDSLSGLGQKNFKNSPLKYEPIVLGITRASLEVDSFLSAASFQQTTRVLSQAALYKKKDFLKGLKENIIIGNLIPAGTGYLSTLGDLL